jgi:hypothetical protein
MRAHAGVDGAVALGRAMRLWIECGSLVKSSVLWHQACPGLVCSNYVEKGAA